MKGKKLCTDVVFKICYSDKNASMHSIFIYIMKKSYRTIYVQSFLQYCLKIHRIFSGSTPKFIGFFVVLPTQFNRKELIMKANKLIALLSTSALAVALLFSQAMPTTAATETADALPYTLKIVPERTSVSAEEVQNGDVVIPAAVYITGSTRNKFSSGTIKFESDSDSLYFTNVVTGDNGHRQETEQTYESTMGTFSTKLIPYCFGSYIERNSSYTSNSPMFTTNEYACDPIFGASLTSAGPNKITFSVSYYEGIDTNGDGILERDEEKGKLTKDYICDVDDNGTYSYEYIDQSSFTPKTVSATIPRYNPNTPEGEAIPDACNRVVWICGTSQLKDGASFFSKKSDEFPFFYVDLVIEKDTPCGMYNVNFLNNSNPNTGAACELISNDNKNYTLNLVGTSITVGAESISVTNAEKNDAAMYTSDDTNPISATDFADAIYADIAYSDGTTESNVDITNLVNCYGVTPYQLYQQQSSQNLYYSANAPLYANGQILKWKDTGETFSQPILVAKKGDVNYDGSADTTDAFYVLKYYASKSAGSTAQIYNGNSSNPYMENFTFFLADIDTCSKKGDTDTCQLDTNDAFYVLSYYTGIAAGNTPSWNDYIH